MLDENYGKISEQADTKTLDENEVPINLLDSITRSQNPRYHNYVRGHEIKLNANLRKSSHDKLSSHLGVVDIETNNKTS